MINSVESSTVVQETEREVDKLNARFSLLILALRARLAVYTFAKSKLFISIKLQ